MVGNTYGDSFLPARGLPLDSLKGLLGELKFLILMKSQFLSLLVYGYYLFCPWFDVGNLGHLQV